MSLRVWLPLNGDTRNIGASGAIVTGNNLSWADDGKFGGKCASFNGTNSYLTGTPTVLTNSTSEYSVACWLKLNKTHSFSPFSQRSAVNSAGYTIFYNGQFLIDDGGRYTSTAYTLPVGEWFHLTITRKQGEGKKVFVNGVQIFNATMTYTATSANISQFKIGASQNTATSVNNYYLNGKMNDWRLYDHALSLAEIHELQQALCLHYKLDGFMSGAVPNIVSGTNNWSRKPGSKSGNTENMRWYVNSGGDGTGSVFEVTDLPEVGDIRGFRITGNTTGNRDWIQTSVPYVEGKTYTASFWARGSGRMLFRVWKTSAQVTYTATLTSDWKHYSKTFTATANIVGGSFQLGVSGAGNIDVCAMKLEEGDTATPYAPSILDMQSKAETVSDASGYNNNASIIRDLSFTPDNCRHAYSMYIDADSTPPSYLELTPLSFENLETGTASVWIRTNATQYTMMPKTRLLSACTPTLDSNITINYASTNAALELYYESDSNSNLAWRVSGTDITSAIIDDNNWHNIAVTWNLSSKIIKGYCDGELVDTESISDITTMASHDIFRIGLPFASYLDTQGLWDKNTLNDGLPSGSANMSDLRIYASELSADDIMGLYQTCAKLDGRARLHTYSVHESGKNNISQHGIVNTGCVCEDYILQQLKYDNNLYFEPDGSVWVHIFHHNAPGTNGVFNQGDTFSSGVYLDEHRWFNVNVCDVLTKWELMFKSKITSSTNEQRLRWIQNANPMTATYEEVAAAEIERNPLSIYYSSGWGGLFKKDSSTLLCINNGTKSNWYGAVGSWTLWNNGIPGFWSGAGALTSGYVDLYVRIDNQNPVAVPCGKTTGSNIWFTDQLIES